MERATGHRSSKANSKGKKDVKNVIAEGGASHPLHFTMEKAFCFFSPAFNANLSLEI